MPQPKFSLSKRQIQAIVGAAIVVLFLALLVISYPWLQMHLANRLIKSGNYALAEQILLRLVEGKPDWTKPRYDLALSQLYLGKGSEAASTVISLADASRLDDLELAIIFMDVAEHLLNSGHGDAALELAARVLAERPTDKMLSQAVVEIGFTIAQRSELPLSLDALNLSLSLEESNWMLNRKAFNILLDKALEAPAHLAEPALDAALKLYPSNSIALISKASLLGARQGPKAALEYLAEREETVGDNFTEDYLNTKRTLITRLAAVEPDADLTRYVRGMPQSTLVELAIQGLKQSSRQEISGYQYYQLAMTEPEVAYQYARNLVQIQDWEGAREIFADLKELDPGYLDFQAVNALMDSKTRTTTEAFHTPGYSSDMASISPDGNYLASRLWMDQPPLDDFLFSYLSIINLRDGSRKSLGDAQVFQWASDGKHLAYLTNSPAGKGRLHIYSVKDETTFTLSGEYDVLSFNWAGNSLMVQAEKDGKMRLLHLVPSNWRIVEEMEGDSRSGVNQDYAWISKSKNSLVIHKYRQAPREILLDQDILAFSAWSPDGHLAIIAGQAGKSWIYNYRDDQVTEIPIRGEFAAWGHGQTIYWYFPVWEKQYVLVRLDETGRISEYLPYSFSYPQYDLSVTSDGSAAVLVEDSKVLIHRKQQD